MKILIVRLSALGDIIHTLPLALNASLAGGRVGWLAERAYASLLANNPSVERVFVAETRRWRKNPLSPSRFREILSLRRDLRDFGADFTIDAQGLWKSAVAARLAGGPVVGFAKSNRREPVSAILCDHPVRMTRDLPHVVDQNLSLLAPLGVPVVRKAPDARYLLEATCAESARFLATLPRRFVLYHPGAGRPEKSWGEERYAELARILAREQGLLPAISWGPGDEPRLERLALLLPEAVPAPRLGMIGLAHLISRSSLFVAGDTGPLHLADALGVATLALFRRGTRNGPERNGPYRGRAIEYDETTRVGEVAAVAAALLAARERNAPT